MQSDRAFSGPWVKGQITFEIVLPLLKMGLPFVSRSFSCWVDPFTFLGANSLYSRHIFRWRTKMILRSCLKMQWFLFMLSMYTVKKWFWEVAWKCSDSPLCLACTEDKNDFDKLPENAVIPLYALRVQRTKMILRSCLKMQWFPFMPSMYRGGQKWFWEVAWKCSDSPLCIAC